MAKANRMAKKKKMKLKRDEEGDMGIGTLIVFIAMIMVAAVAAAVMISVSNSLRIQGLKQGLETTKEVSTGIKINSIVADLNKDGDDDPLVGMNTEKLEEIKIRISLLAGSSAIDLDDVKIHIITESKEADLTANTALVAEQGGAANSDTNFSMDKIRDDDDSFLNNHVINSGDFILIWIDCNYTTSTSLNVTPSTDVTVEFFPNVGIKSTWSFTTPATYATRYIELG